MVDLCWISDGYILLACSIDGILCTFKFDLVEIGEKLDDIVVEVFLFEMYGDIKCNCVFMLEDFMLFGFAAVASGELDDVFKGVKIILLFLK